jgi:hypothetical protein
MRTFLDICEEVKQCWAKICGDNDFNLGTELCHKTALNKLIT